MTRAAARKSTPKIDPEERERQHIVAVAEGMEAAASVSVRLFGKPDYAGGVADRLVSEADTLEEAAEDLMVAAGFAKKIYGTNDPTPDMVFDLFDRFWPSEDEPE